MKLYIRIILLVVLLCCAISTFSIMIEDARDNAYVGKLRLSDDTSQFVYYNDSLLHLSDSTIEYLFTFGKDTLCFTTRANNEIEEYSELVEERFKEGKLYKYNYPLSGFNAYLAYDKNLVKQYLCLSDNVYIPNSLYTIELSLIDKKGFLFSHIKKTKGLPKRELFLSTFRRVAYPYETIDSVIFTRRALVSEWNDCYLYRTKYLPEIQLLFQCSGFSSETRHITQYPVIVLSDRDYNSKDLVFNSSSQSLYEIKWSNTGPRKCALLYYNDGYLICLLDSRGRKFPARVTLDSLINTSNLFIKSYLDYHETSLLWNE